MINRPDLDIVFVGSIELWPCRDAIVVLRYHVSPEEGEVRVRPSSANSAGQFMRSAEQTKLHDPSGRPPTQTVQFMPFADSSELDVSLALPLVKFEDAVYRPRYDVARIIGHKVQLKEAQEEALSDFKQAYRIQNLLPTDGKTDSPADKDRASKRRAEELAGEFLIILNEGNEEDAQVFLRDHPEILYPSYLKFYPKYKPASDYVTDFVFYDQGPEGLEYIFVEIERATKRMMNADGNLSHNYTQAKGQLLEWQAWADRNISLLKRVFSSIDKPFFHLVMGRRAAFESPQHLATPGTRATPLEKVRRDFAMPMFRFSTYDDIIDRYKQIVTNWSA